MITPRKEEFELFVDDTPCTKEEMKIFRFNCQLCLRFFFQAFYTQVRRGDER